MGLTRSLMGLAGIFVLAIVAYFGLLENQQGGMNSGNMQRGLIQNTSSDGAPSQYELRSRDMQNDEIVLLATSSLDQKAVVRISDGANIVLSTGDQIGSKGLTLTDVSTNKIVLKGSSNNQTYFVYLVGKNGKSKIQTLFSEISIQTPRPLTPIVDSAKAPGS